MKKILTKKISLAKKIAITIIITMLSTNLTLAANLEKQKQEYDEQAQQALEQSEKLKYKIESVSDAKRLLDEAADEATANFDQKQAELDETLARIDENQARLDKAQKNLKSKQKVLSRRVRDIYINGRLNYLDVLFGASDFSDFMTRMDLFKRVIALDYELVRFMLEQRNEIESTQALLEHDKIEQIQLAEQAEKLRDIQIEKVAAQQELIDAMMYDKDVFDQQYQEMLAASEYIQQLIVERDAAEKLRREKAESRKQKKTPTRTNKNPDDDEEIDLSAFSEMISPVDGEITSEFGWRTHPIFGDRIFHSGIDIAAEYGTPIVAAKDGVVTNAGWISGYGNTVIIDHGSGISSLYGHNQSLAVSVGDEVKQGETISFCGSTGNSTGPHCHFEVRQDGEPVSPWDFLN